MDSHLLANVYHPAMPASNVAECPYCEAGREAEQLLKRKPMPNGAIYVRKFRDLHRDAIPGRWTNATLGKAPHKPLLLLSVIDNYRSNLNRENRIEPTLQIEEAFDHYWRTLFGQLTSTFSLPFFHLQHDQFWRLIGISSQGVTDPVAARSATELRKLVDHAVLDRGLHELLRDSAWNQHLRSTLILSNFDPELHHLLLATR